MKTQCVCYNKKCHDNMLNDLKEDFLLLKADTKFGKTQSN